LRLRLQPVGPRLPNDPPTRVRAAASPTTLLWASTGVGSALLQSPMLRLGMGKISAAADPTFAVFARVPTGSAGSRCAQAGREPTRSVVQTAFAARALASLAEARGDAKRPHSRARQAKLPWGTVDGRLAIHRKKGQWNAEQYEINARSHALQFTPGLASGSAGSAQSVRALPCTNEPAILVGQHGFPLAFHCSRPSASCNLDWFQGTS